MQVVEYKVFAGGARLSRAESAAPHRKVHCCRSRKPDPGNAGVGNADA